MIKCTGGMGKCVIVNSEICCLTCDKLEECKVNPKGDQTCLQVKLNRAQKYEECSLAVEIKDDE